jgi:hypothetical protein
MKILSSNKLMRTAALAGVLGFSAALLLSIPASAQPRPGTTAPAPAPGAPQAKTPGTGQALEIAPPVINLKADPGQTIKTQISLRDVSSGKLLVKSQLNDFVAAGEDGTPKILLDEAADEPNPYSLKTWIAPLPELLLNPQQIRQLPVTINVPANAAPGGYYGVVRFTATAPEMTETGVSLSASLGSLILVRVNGAATEKLEIEEFFISKDGKRSTIFQSAPLNFTERIKNTGNLHQQPSGHVTITDMFGKKVAAVNVNLPPRNILPASIRKFEQPLDRTVIGNNRLFGKYTATLKVKYGTDEKTISESMTFWVIPYTLIGIIIAVLVVGFFVLRFGLKRYNQHIINQSRGKRRK